ncbi:MAG: phosphotransferase, partial [Eubacterium sp.]
MCEQPLFADHLGRFFANNLFYSSDLYMTAYKRQELLKFFDNPEYTALDFFLFEDCVVVSNTRTMPKDTWSLRKKIIENPLIQNEIKRLRHLFNTEKECLIHTDLHASNIMISQNKVKIIDTEFAGFGPLAQDLGRLTASFCLNFCSWYGDPDHTEGEKSVFRAWLLNTIDALYHTFNDEFSRLCAKYSGDSYSLRTLDIDAYLMQHLKDSLCYTALNAASRIGDRGICYDLERLSPENRIYPDLLILTLCEEIFTHKERYTTITMFTDYLRTLAFKHPIEFYNVGK